MAGVPAATQDGAGLSKERFVCLAALARHHRTRCPRFVMGSFRPDYDAVHAALTLAWSNGPVEGQISRLKAHKRQMYGRASLDLLERRFLLAA